jgi:hypothetical protein
VLCGDTFPNEDGEIIVQLWDLNTRTRIAERTLVAKKATTAFQFSFTPDGQSIILLTSIRQWKSGPKYEFHIWRRAGLKPVESPELPMDDISYLQFAPDGRTAIAIPNAGIEPKKLFQKKNSFQLAFLDYSSWKLLGISDHIQGFQPFGPLGRVVLFLPDHKTFVLQRYDVQGTKSMFVRDLWDLGQRKPIIASAGTGLVAGAVTYSEDNRFFWSDEIKELLPIGLGWRELAQDKQIGPVYPLSAPSPSTLLYIGSRNYVPPKHAFGLDSAGSLWQIAQPNAVPGNPERVRIWVEVITGFELDDTGEVQQLHPAAWQQRKERLAELGGPPVP